MSGSGDVLIERIAALVVRWGLAMPAVAFLEANKPLSFVSSQVLLLLQPMLDTFIARDLTTDLAGLLADRERLEKLVARLATVESKG